MLHMMFSFLGFSLAVLPPRTSDSFADKVQDSSLHLFRLFQMLGSKARFAQHIPLLYIIPRLAYNIGSHLLG